MRLLLSGTSPFARKVQMVLIEKSLLDQVEMVPVNAWVNTPELTKYNPLSQVPVLVLDDGEAMFDSGVICSFLDELQPLPQLLPAGGVDRARIMRMQALTDGVTDAAVQVRMQRVAADGQPDSEQTTRLYNKVVDSLSFIETELPKLKGELNLGMVCCGATLGYLDLRFPEMGWRAKAPQLATWYEEFAARPSMQQTAPSE